MSTKQILKVMYVLCWIIFIGLGIQSGGYIVNAFLATENPEMVPYLWHEADLSALFTYSTGHYAWLTFIISIVTILKAVMFYLIIRLLHSKKVTMEQPFNKEMERFMINLVWFTVGIGLCSYGAVNYFEWLTQKGITMPDIKHLPVGGADVWLFMAAVLFVLVQIFKRGVELQTENDLTV